MMRLEIRFENGRRAEALMLAVSSRQIRVVVQGSAETEEWQKVDGTWRDEDGDEVDIEALIAIDMLSFGTEIGTRAMSGCGSY